MKEETNYIGYSFMGNTDYFDDVYDTEEEAIKAAKEARVSGNSEEEVPRFVRILQVLEIDKEALAENAIISALEYMDETYDDFEAGIDDGNIIRSKDLFKEVLPALVRNFEFGGMTQKGEVMYVYDLDEDRKTFYPEAERR